MPPSSRETIVIPRLDVDAKAGRFPNGPGSLDRLAHAPHHPFHPALSRKTEAAVGRHCRLSRLHPRSHLCRLHLQRFDPGAHSRAHARRAMSQGGDDDVFIMLDTFHDQRRAFYFQSNVLGIQSDALYSEQTGYDLFLRYSLGYVGQTHRDRLRRADADSLRQPLLRQNRSRRRCGPGASSWGAMFSTSTSTDYWPRMNHNIAGRLTQDIAVEGFARRRARRESAVGALFPGAKLAPAELRRSPESLLRSIGLSRATAGSTQNLSCTTAWCSIPR